MQCYDDWPGKGFLRHEHVIMCSDEFTDADFICHMDTDCMFIGADDTRGLLRRMVSRCCSTPRYHWLITEQQANLGMWQDGG